jgi:hypothetical protein
MEATKYPTHFEPEKPVDSKETKYPSHFEVTPPMGPEHTKYPTNFVPDENNG